MNKFLRSQAIEPTVRTFSSQGDIRFEHDYLPIDWTEQVIAKWGYKRERASNLTTSHITDDGYRSTYVISFAYAAHNRAGQQCEIRPVVIQVNVVNSTL